MSDNAKLCEISRLLASFILAIRTYREREIQFLQELQQLFGQMVEQADTTHVQEETNTTEVDEIYGIDEDSMDIDVD